MPSNLDADDVLSQKALFTARWVHIGNDSVHVVWSDSVADYDPALLPTQVNCVGEILEQHTMFKKNSHCILILFQ